MQENESIGFKRDWYNMMQSEQTRQIRQIEIYSGKLVHYIYMYHQSFYLPTTKNISGRLKSPVESTNGRQIPEVTEEHSSNCSSGNCSVELIWVALLTLVHQSYFSNMLLLEKIHGQSLNIYKPRNGENCCLEIKFRIYLKIRNWSPIRINHTLETVFKANL